MPTYPRPASREEFRIAVICALTIERNAVEAMFDEDWEEEPKYTKLEHDKNTYTMGRIGVHNVVLAYMPGIGKVNSAILAAQFKFSFPQIRLGLVVGICGGTPFIREFPRSPREIDVFLGDVVISTGVVQYDLGRQYSDKFEPADALKDVLGRPDGEIRSFLGKMDGLKSRERVEGKIRKYLTQVLSQKSFRNEKWKYQGVDKDILYESTYRHKHHESTDCVCAQCQNKEDKVCQQALDSTCEELKCNPGTQVRRTRKLGDEAAVQANASSRSVEAPSPCIHFGVVASGDSVLKSAYHRDALADRKEVIGFEMEGAGAWDTFHIIVIKGVVDYADSHKSYAWQKYGALCGAACMKALVTEWMLTEKIPQLAAGSSTHGTPNRQTGESSAMTQEESNSQPKLANLRENVNEAYSHLKRRNKDTMREDLETARRILLQAEVQSTETDMSLRQRIYWGLMAVEKELSCYKDLKMAERIEHINNAQKHGIQVAELVSQSPDASLCAQVTLEQCFIKGIKALMDVKVDKDMDKMKRTRLEARNGIDASLGKLREVDLQSYEEYLEPARKWYKKFAS